jgi:basic membrane protein A
MKKYLALILALCLAFALCACGTTATQTTAAPTSAATTQPAETAAAAASIPVADLKIASSAWKMKLRLRLCPHLRRSGRCQISRIPEDQVIFKYNIGEDETCYDACCDLAEQGCQLVITDSYGHQSYAQQAAAEYPDVTFVSMTGDTAALSGLANFKNAFCNTYESRYVSGVVAGMKLQELINDNKLSDKNYDADGNVKVGYVGAYPYAEVVSGYTSFFLGVRSIVKNVVMDVQFTNSWYDPTAEAEAANALISDGCCIISQHADSTGAPGAVEAALDAGTVVYCVGYNVGYDVRSPQGRSDPPPRTTGAYTIPTLSIAC